MSRRVSLPQAEDLFRPTVVPAPDPSPGADDGAATVEGVADEADPRPRSTGRVRHDEKITVYVSGEELIGLESARLTLRARHGLGVDRGRLVRAAVALGLADLEERGEDSALLDLLRES